MSWQSKVHPFGYQHLQLSLPNEWKLHLRCHQSKWTGQDWFQQRNLGPRCFQVNATRLNLSNKKNRTSELEMYLFFLLSLGVMLHYSRAHLLLFTERKPLAQPMRPEVKPSSSRTPPPVAGKSASSPVEGSSLSSLWFPKEGDFFAQTSREKPFSSKQKVPLPGKEKKEQVRTRRLPSHKLPNQENIGTQTGDLKPEESTRFRGDRVLSLRGQPEPKPGGRSARSLYPPPLRKSTSEVPKQVKKKPTKKPEKDFVCHDPECPYHRKPGQHIAVTCPMQPTGLRGRVPDMWSGSGRPKTKTPYRPRGGYLYDPELDTKKTRGSKKPVLHRPSSAESLFLIVRPPSLGASDSAEAGGAAAATVPPQGVQGVQVVPEVTPHFASFIKQRCLYLQDRSTRTLSPTMCTIKIPHGPVSNMQSVRNMQSHLTQCNQLHEIRWI